MAYLIDQTYFHKTLYIPNVDELNSSISVKLTQFIDDASRLFLKDTLGYQNFKALDAYIDANGNLLPTAPQHFQDLVHGAEYTKGGNTYYWEGLLYTHGAFKKSVIAHYVFTQWLQHNHTQASGVGQVVLEAKNALRINSTERYVTVWNAFVDMYQGEGNTHYPEVAIYDGVTFTDWQSQNNGYVSMLTYIQDHKADFAVFPQKRFQIKNQLGL